MPSITYNITTSNPIQSASLKGKQQALALAKDLIQGLAGGVIKGSIDIHTATANGVAAAGVITPTFANVDADDTITIGGVVLTAKVSGNGTTQFTIGADLAALCTNIAACINANTTLSPHLTATASSTTVAISANLKGSIGNLIVMSTSDGTAFAFTQMAGGTGGPASDATSY